MSEVPIEELLAAETDIRPVYKRNPRLIEAMNKAKLNQRAGSGLLRIKEELSKNGSHKPDGSLGLEIKNDEKRNRFALTIFRRETFDPRQLSDKRSINPLHQLPPPPADFTGRTAELRELRAAIEKGGVHISGLQGQGGVGKTALALKLAEDLAPNFPDAQIYLDLKGVSEKPLTAAEAMSHVLRTFHPEAKLPEKEEDLRAQYLSVLHNKRALLLMDNAKDAAQVKPLIPPPVCALLVTSRQHFALPGLQAKNLETLPPPDAKDLLLRIAPRIDSEAEAIAKLCGYLPQALRLAASAIAVRVNLEPRDYARQLADEKKRLELLAGDDESVTASITLSYNLLDTETQKLWRMLAVFPDTLYPAAAAAVWEIEAASATEALSRLVQFSILEWNESTKRYRLHDLMRDFVRQRWTLAESEAAARCHARHYLEVVRAATTFYRKGGDSILLSLALFDLERENIQAGQAWSALHAAEGHEAAKLCSSYPDSCADILSLRQHPREQIRWLEAALGAARQLNNRAAESRHLTCMGVAYTDLGEARRSIQYLERALAIDREIGDRSGEGADLGNLGNAHLSLGDARLAIEYHERHLAIALDTGDRSGEGKAAGNLGNAYDLLGEARRAIEYHQRHLMITRETGDSQGEANALGSIGNGYYSLGDYRRAIEYYKKGLAIAKGIGDRLGGGKSLCNIGIAHAALGETRRAIEYYTKALVIDSESGDMRGEGSDLWNMSLALDILGERRKAIEHAEAALKILEEIEDPIAPNVRKQLDMWRNG
jgi:tetratricopeptide (TPR) repeat protein